MTLQFHDWVDRLKTPGSKSLKFKSLQAIVDQIEEWGRDWALEGLNQDEIDTRSFYVATDLCWRYDKRPYYSIYPKIADALIKTSLDIQMSEMDFPTYSNCLLVRFAKGYELYKTVRTMLVGVGDFELQGIRRPTQLTVIASHYPENSAELLHCDFQNYQTLNEITSSIAHSRELGYTVGKRTLSEVEGAGLLRLAMGIALLEKDPELIVPDVLNEDRAKMLATTDPEIVQKLADKAARNGKKGWIVGECTEEREGYEVAAHYRRPHFAIRWTGKGKTIPKLCAIKGSVVHREKLTEVPTGYLDNEPLTTQ